jgi:hypothetical protein
MRIPGRGVLYYLRGGRHANVLVVSLASLRNHWQGPVCLLCGDDEAVSLAKRIAADPRLTDNFSWSAFKGDEGKRGTGYSTKTLLTGLSPFDETLFIDADTLVVGDLGELWPTHGEVVLTQFASWVSSGPRISGRLAKWIDHAPDEVYRMSQYAYPAINTGVMAWRGDAGAFGRAWREMCLRNPTWICDEIACQLIFPDHDCRIADERWNCSPIHSERHKASLGDVRIYHFHGKKHIKRDAGRAVWWQYYEEACRLNLAGIADWTPGGDRELKEYLRTLGTQVK